MGKLVGFLLLVAAIGGGYLVASGKLGVADLPSVTNTADTKEQPKQVYQCTKAGSVIYSDKPCGENEQKITIRKTTVMDNSALRERTKKQLDDSKEQGSGPNLHVIPDSTKQPIGVNPATPDDCNTSTEAGANNRQNCNTHQDWKTTVTDSLKSLVK